MIDALFFLCVFLALLCGGFLFRVSRATEPAGPWQRAIGKHSTLQKTADAATLGGGFVNNGLQGCYLMPT